MTMRRKPSGRFAGWLAGLLACAVCVSAAWATDGYAAAPKPDPIRVALYINNGKGYNVTVPTVALSSADGLDIGIRTQTGVRSWTNAPAGTQVRFSPDGFNVLLLETADASKARGLVQALSGKQDKPYLFQTSKLGKPSYRLYAGMYATKEEAEAAKTRLSAVPAIAAALAGAPAVVTGPLHLSAGTFDSVAAAEQQAESLRLKGIDAWTVLTEAADKPAFAVWVGEAADAAQLNEAKAKASQLVPGLTLTPVDPNAAYLLKRADGTAAAAAGGTGISPHYAFNPAGQTVRIGPLSSGTIAVAEKSGRQYRGVMELSVYNGRMAVVNELPLEQYLVSVVSSEMGDSWPLEALKAQAVAARTFAVRQGVKYGIAHVSDSSLDQVYNGVGSEGANAKAAVEATAGEVMLAGSSPIEPYFSSNSGGMTGDPVEVWGQPIGYLKPTASPDEGAARNVPEWLRVVLADGQVGYVRSDLARDTGERNMAGLPVYEANENGVNIRSAPYVNDTSNPPIATARAGEPLVVLGKTAESNAYAWIRGPYKADALAKQLNAAIPGAVNGKLLTLQVSKRGPSGRATELAANGAPITAAKPDQYRNALFGAPSTKFEIEETGRYTVLGAGGRTRSIPESSGPLYALTGTSGAASVDAALLADPNLILLGGGGAVRAATKDPQFILTGNGFGHGLGMSQWGARGLAEQGYDYKRILTYYYTGAAIVKE